MVLNVNVSSANTEMPFSPSAISKGGLIVINGQPCKVSDMTSFPSGKHGNAKWRFTAHNIFNNKKLQHMVLSRDDPNRRARATGIQLTSATGVTAAQHRREMAQAQTRLQLQDAERRNAQLAFGTRDGSGVWVPVVRRTEYLLADIHQGFMLLIATGNTTTLLRGLAVRLGDESECEHVHEEGDHRNLKLPNFPVTYAGELQALFDEGKPLIVTVLNACGHEQVMSHKRVGA